MAQLKIKDQVLSNGTVMWSVTQRGGGTLTMASGAEGLEKCRAYVKAYDTETKRIRAAHRLQLLKQAPAGLALAGIGLLFSFALSSAWRPGVEALARLLPKLWGLLPVFWGLAVAYWAARWCWRLVAGRAF